MIIYNVENRDRKSKSMHRKLNFKKLRLEELKN